MILKRILSLGIERLYALLIIICCLCFACLVFVPSSSILSSIFILLGFITFGILGIVCIYFREMPGFGKTIKGAYAVITGYAYLLCSLVASIIIIYRIIVKY
jgi:hypothetical protein